MELDLRQLLQIARRRWWIVALLMLIAGSAAYLSAKRETPMYSASAAMLVSPGQSYAGAGVDYNSLMLTQYLAETYPPLITNSDMRQRVADALGVESIPSGISASAAKGSQLIYVTVTDTDPERAANVANAVVSEFQGYIADQAQGRANDARSGLDAQIAALQKRIDQIDARLAELDGQSTPDAKTQREIDDLTQERGNINDSLVNLNTNAVTIDAQVLAASARVEPAGSAVTPTVPFSPQPRRSATLGLFVGLLLGVGVVALLEFLDNTVKPEQNIQALTGAPLLATVSSLNRLQPGGGQVYAMSQPRSNAAESIRLLRTNLEFASASADIKSITVTSPGPGEGKSTTVANLGVVMAQAGLDTVVIDADLRKPTLERVFGVTNESGLTTLLTHPDEDWQRVARKVALPGLRLIPSGPLPPNPSDLVSSARFEALLERVTADADIVIIDSPPVLSASDALAIARHTDGVVLVCQSHRTRIDALRHGAHLIHQGGIRLVGVVLNRQRGQQGASYYGEYYGVEAASGD